MGELLFDGAVAEVINSSFRDDNDIDREWE
jgi:hypothetical protein